jgi:flagellar motility protein MotE (MotC chaperone)
VKKLALILLLILGMALSFAAISLVMLFAMRVVSSVDEARQLLIGEMPGAGSVYTETNEIIQVQDALTLLRQHKQELEGEITKLKEHEATLATTKDSLSAQVRDLAQQGSQTNEEAARARAARLSQMVTLYSAMRPGDAAAIFDGMSDDIVLELLPLLKDRQAARILNGLADNDRKAALSAQLLTGEAPAQP